MAMVAETPLPVSYFGKLPTRGDFVRTSESHPLMGLLDRWAGQGVELLTQDPGWKQLYDEAQPMHFAFIGSRNRLGIGGHFLPSRDATDRRFPFLTATRLELSQPLGFIGRSPLALSRLWSTLARLSRQALAAADAAEPLRELAESRIGMVADHAVYDAPFHDFLDLQDVASLQALLRESGHPHLSLKWTLPALGLLLQPLLSGGLEQVDKGLSLPLPRDPLYRPLVAAFWLDLIAGFLTNADVELAILIKEASREGAHAPEGPRLVVGFHGADGRTLQAALDPQIAADRIIRVDDAEWVESYIEEDAALARLVSYLERDELSMRTARTSFGETFLGK
ncbi:type VI secretion system-associated protein TagF [Lysobacter sp. cf310]|uniref:type VI secretion system-associated protein TagF n=1 Tax=Lysobacter sp. cf310 TaxID=1761790 RepID=UPI0008E9A992|nr:type VI secretion system-associated protein TagF [Lysobacter sp. cf310]SFK92911.1 type VI secretion system protein ImpM [Lysobacter sp. cf310]